MAKQRAQRVPAHRVVEEAVYRHMTRIREAAVRMLGATPDDEAVHDFRVGMRRLRTVLRASRNLYGKKRVDALSKGLANFGKATNALRDAEVLAETLEQTELSKQMREQTGAWLERRGPRDKRLRRIAMVYVRGSQLVTILRRIERLVRRGPKRKQSFSEFAADKLERAQKNVRRKLPVAEHDVEKMHSLRIQFKQLRYTAEMLAGFARDAGRQERAKRTRFTAIARAAAELQKVLGVLHDIDVAVEAVRRARSLDPTDKTELTDSLDVRRGRVAREVLRRLKTMPAATLGR